MEIYCVGTSFCMQQRLCGAYVNTSVDCGEGQPQGLTGKSYAGSDFYISVVCRVL